MAKLIALYNPPQDAAAFDEHYINTHIPLALTMPGVRSAQRNDGEIHTPNGPSPYHMVGILNFDSMADLQAGLASPQGMATVADLANFAGAGVTVLMFDDVESVPAPQDA